MDAIIILGVLCLVCFSYAIYTAWRLDQQRQRTDKQLAEQRAYYEKNKLHSNETQRAVIKGQLAEQFYPIMGDCPFEPSDMKFLGMPIDYIVFDGYTDAKDAGGQIREIVFVEIKSGSSQLSRHQRQIRDAIIDKRVRWQTITL